MNSGAPSTETMRQRCPDLLVKCWLTSVAELDGKIYIVAEDIAVRPHIHVYMMWSKESVLNSLLCRIINVV